MTRANRNRLDEEESPYLLAHADNPVHWQPWDDAALSEARERDAPIFLSIGYAACHWCHVMAEESFEDEEVAAVLNDQFVPIKVDREERPDVDRIYQTICQQVSGRGGWPLSVWLTPDQNPFLVGTYFPKRPKRRMPGFLDRLEQVAESWRDPDERAELEDRAAEWREAVSGQLESVPDEPTTPGGTIVEEAAKAAVRGADRERGGWGTGPKFPMPGRLHLLFRAYDRTERDVYLEVATETLDGMSKGGMFDHVGGGFHRYAVDRDWTVPHFEKMLYDNATLPLVYLAGFQLTGDAWYGAVANNTLEFVERELTHEEGGFYSTLDAQSEDADGRRVEGAYYVWTPEEVHEVIEDDLDADLFCDAYDVTPEGNFDRRRTVLTLARPIDELAPEYDLEQEAVIERLDRAGEQIQAARAARPRPPRDEKILAGWNGLAISAFAEGALVIDSSYATSALDALTFVQDNLWDGDAGRLQRRYAAGVTKFDGYLEDYAFLARGALDCYQATGGIEQLDFAIDLARAIQRCFWDEGDGTLYFTPSDGESLIARPQELTDQSTPSSIGVAAETLASLSHFAPEENFDTIAETVVETHGSRIRSNPLQHASLTLAADTVRDGPLELTLVADSPPDEWAETLADTYVSPRLVSRRPADYERFQAWLDTLGRESPPPIWTNRKPQDGTPTVYACRSQTCSPPREELSRAIEWAKRVL